MMNEVDEPKQEEALPRGKEAFEPCVNLDFKTINTHYENNNDASGKSLTAMKIRQAESEACEAIMDPEGWLDRKKEESHYLAIVFYMGDWSWNWSLGFEQQMLISLLISSPKPFNILYHAAIGKSCEIYLRAFDELQASVMSEHDCKLYGFSSQTQKKVNRHVKNWRLTSFECIVGDHVNSFAKHLRDSPDLFPELEITDCSKDAPTMHPFLTKKLYPFGATQPAVIFFANGKPLLRWTNKPEFSNYGGTLRRPDPEEIWKEVLFLEKQGEDAHISDGNHLRTIVGCCEVTRGRSGCHPYAHPKEEKVEKAEKEKRKRCCGCTSCTCQRSCTIM